ncbi:hypothetical protein IFVP203_C2170063 [Vibrio parahaemolyticus]
MFITRSGLSIGRILNNALIFDLDQGAVLRIESNSLRNSRRVSDIKNLDK